MKWLLGTVLKFSVDVVRQSEEGHNGGSIVIRSISGVKDWFFNDLAVQSSPDFASLVQPKTRA